MRRFAFPTDEKCNKSALVGGSLASYGLSLPHPYHARMQHGASALSPLFVVALPPIVRSTRGVFDAVVKYR